MDITMLVLAAILLIVAWALAIAWGANHPSRLPSDDWPDSPYGDPFMWMM